MAKTTKKKSKGNTSKKIIFPDYINKLTEMLALYETKVPTDNPLPEQDKNNIMETCIDLYNVTGNYQQIYHDCHRIINTTLSSYNYQPRTPGATPPDSNAMQHLPYELKILIYTMAYKAFELYDNAIVNNKNHPVKKPSQNGILEFISTPLSSKSYPCYSLSPKTFTQFGMSPKVFYDTNNYKQIQLPSTYAGAKTHHRGYALNHLVAYAGTIDNYVDLFGGSASAFMAVTQTNNVEYYINELEFFVVNYYMVLADDKLYSDYIKELCKVRDKFKEIMETGTGEEEGRDFFNTCASVAEQWNKRYPSSNSDILVNGQIIKSPNWQQYASETAENKTDAAVAYTYIHSFSVAGGKNHPSAVSETSLKKFCRFDVKEYDKLHTRMARLKEIYNSNMLDNTEFLIEYFTDKAPTKYSTIETLAKSMRNGNTPVNISGKNQELLRLLGKDSNKKPRLFRTLFYSDSPYLNTSGYKSGGISIQQMQTLIKKLVTASQNGSHFIFSCRASMSIEDNKFQEIQGCYIDLNKHNRINGNVILDTARIYEEMSILVPGSTPYGKRLDIYSKKDLRKIAKLLKQNNDIYEHIFKEFEKCSDKFYVLACLETNRFKKTTGSIKNTNIEIMLQNMFSIEAFITDYDFVCPLTYTSSAGKIYYWKKYTISQFCNLLYEKMFKSNRDYEVVPKSNATESGYSFQ